MYSLYRAWLSLGTPLLPPPPPPPPPAHPPALSYVQTGSPDIVIQVGPGMTQFSAHRNVLILHSGYFKAALINQHESAPILVPNINVDEFSTLLTFMYTGYLDLNFSNIYNVLLASHILHMTNASELCRTFLIRNSPATPLTTAPTVIKPIANRRSPPPPAAVETTNQRIQPPNFHQSDSTLFKTVNKPTTSQQRPAEETPQRKKINRQRNSQDNDDKVIIDVACCDGPVRFQRVLNRNYGKNVQTNEHHAVPVTMANSNAALNKIMNENIQQRQLDEENNEGGNTTLFTCLYCNHTFKSQYCYQKHARRHLNPVAMATTSTATATAATATVSDNDRREVKLLDMNVQYYPCKTCGSKFPSYYFVHKHRKMCHGDEGNATATAENDENARLLPDNNTSSDSSAIDVEAINDS